MKKAIMKIQITNTKCPQIITDFIGFITKLRYFHYLSIIVHCAWLT